MLFGLPLSVLTTLGGGLMGFITKMFAMKMQFNAAKEKHTLDLMAAKQDVTDRQVENEIKLLEARGKFETTLSRADPHFSWTRRILTFMIIGIAGLVIPAVAVFGDVSWFHLHEWTDKTNGFFGLGAKTTEVIDVVSAKGLPLIFASEFLAFAGSIVGFYFGQSAAKMSCPYTKK